jgi:hypothetical protein
MSDEPRKILRRFYILFVVVAFRENIEASSKGLGVVECVLTDEGYPRRIASGEPLNIWACAGAKAEGQSRTDTELLAEEFNKGNTVFILFRERYGSSERAKTLGLARMTGSPGAPHTRPFPHWPRTHTTGTKVGGWMQQIPFPVKWYFTAEMDDVDHGYGANVVLPFTFGMMDMLVTRAMMQKLYHECTANNGALKAVGKLTPFPENLADFTTLANFFNFGTPKPYGGRIRKLPYDRPIE